MATASEPTDQWRREIFRSVGSWMVAKLDVPAGPTIAATERVRQLDGLPLTAEAFRTGRLSTAQAVEIAEISSEWPETEDQRLGVDPPGGADRPPHRGAVARWVDDALTLGNQGAKAPRNRMTAFW